jgi:hypothetical protein
MRSWAWTMASSMRTSFRRRLGSSATKQSFLASSRAVMMSISLTRPCSLARALNSSSSPARTVRLSSWRWTISRPSWISSLVGAGAVAPEQELADVGRHRILALEAAHQVLADDEAVEGPGGDLVERVELHVPHHHQHRGRALVPVVGHQQRGRAVRGGRQQPAVGIEHGRPGVRRLGANVQHRTRETTLQLHAQAQALPLGAGDLTGWTAAGRRHRQDGIRASCTLRPPWLYSTPALKAEIPGAKTTNDRRPRTRAAP